MRTYNLQVAIIRVNQNIYILFEMNLNDFDQILKIYNLRTETRVGSIITKITVR